MFFLSLVNLSLTCLLSGDLSKTQLTETICNIRNTYDLSFPLLYTSFTWPLLALMVMSVCRPFTDSFSSVLPRFVTSVTDTVSLFYPRFPLGHCQTYFSLLSLLTSEPHRPHFQIIDTFTLYTSNTNIFKIEVLISQLRLKSPTVGKP